MSYSIAKNCFKENILLTGGVERDPVSFNLFNGLHMLAGQLERDMLALQNQLRRIENEVSSSR